MVQNSTATNSTLIDLSKVERQAGGEQRRSEDSHNLNTLLQDILCFFILLSLGLLIVASIFCVALNIHHTATHQQSQRNKSHLISANGPTIQERLSLQGPIWIRFFRFQKQHQQPEHDAKLEQVRGPEGDMVQTVQLKEQHMQQPHFGPTYQPNDYSDLAGGDYVEAKGTVKESDSEPQSFSVDNFLRT
ncbi:hypothetical protein KR032_011574 [Drosophila birchii]|nr:hypothetical protein KR032_011574 [Drosophila birchii]